MKEVRYLPQLKRNMLGLVVSIRDGNLKMTKGSMVVIKGVHRNNLYYLKDRTVAGQMETFISSDDVCTQV